MTTSNSKPTSVRGLLLAATIVAIAAGLASRRVADLQILAGMLRERDDRPIRMQGGMTTGERRDAVTHLRAAEAGDGIITVGITPFIGEGFDPPALDTLFLAAPVSYDGLLIQCAGRILHEAPAKTTAVVHHRHDAMVPALAASLGKRVPGYRALRLDIVTE